jgi:hypothetical protein
MLFSLVQVALQKLFALKLIYFGAKNINEIKKSQFNKVWNLLRVEKTLDNKLATSSFDNES